MMKSTYLIPLAIVLSFLQGCADLDVRPNSDIILPKSPGDFEDLLNHESVTTTGALAHLHGGEFLAPEFATWQSWPKLTQRNAYIWNKDLYEGEENIPDWNMPYTGIFYCNSVLDHLGVLEGYADYNRLKGWALFARAYLLYDLVLNFSPAFDPARADTQLGIPLKLTSAIDEVQPRSSLKACYDQIIGDMQAAESLIDQSAPTGNRNQPSKAAVSAFLAQIHLQMGDYPTAETYATQALSLFDTLTDYNTLDTLSNNPFTYNTPETFYFSRQAYGYLTYGNLPFYFIDPNLVALYEQDDLRRKLYLLANGTGEYWIKPINTFAGQPFTGLAVDELYLIKAECLARRGYTHGAMELLNALWESRYKQGTFTPMAVGTADVALTSVLAERQRALLYRGRRWADIKRLNREGHNITLSRELNGTTYSLPPNDTRYVFPIPDDEITRSGIQQNNR